MIRGQVLLTGGPTEWVRGFKTWARKSLKIGVSVWHRSIRPKHFKPGAQGAYRMMQRNPKYMRRKWREKRHALPLVWTGRARQLSALPPRITATFKSAKAAMNVPGYIHMVPKRRRAPPLGEELTRVTDAELRQAAGQHAQRVAASLNRADTKRTER